MYSTLSATPFSYLAGIVMLLVSSISVVGRTLDSGLTFQAIWPKVSRCILRSRADYMTTAD
jgi:hypothetical protein